MGTTITARGPSPATNRPAFESDAGTAIADENWAGTSAKRVLPAFHSYPDVPLRGTWHDRQFLESYKQYALACYALAAVDSKDSYHVNKSEAEKNDMWDVRLQKFLTLERSYHDDLRRAQNRAKKWAKETNNWVVRQEAPCKTLAQVKLFQDAWPDAFDYIAARFPHRPLVTNDFELGVTVRNLSDAMCWKYIQYNSPIADHLLIIDYDAPSGVSIHEIIEQAKLPWPTWIAHTPRTARGHLAWSLAAPVCTTSAARLKPLQYLARIEEGYRRAINGDARFTGLLTKNPVCDEWDVEWIDPRARTLDDLAGYVEIKRYSDFKTKIVNEIEPVGLGRKVLTFDKARKWAYSAVSRYWEVGLDSWHSAVRGQIDVINRTFHDPLPESHTKAIAKSISKWVWARFTPLTKHQLVLATHMPVEQARRGALKGAKRRDTLLPRVREFAAQGLVQREIEKLTGVPQKTISRWLQKS